MYFDSVEAMERTALEELQVDRLKTTIENAKNAPFYGGRLAGINPNDIKTVADITKLPDRKSVV